MAKTKVIAVANQRGGVGNKEEPMCKIVIFSNYIRTVTVRHWWKPIKNMAVTVLP